MAKQVKSAESVKAVIAALGGPQEVAAWLDVGLSTVCMWPHRGFPPDTYKAMTDKLKRNGYRAPPSLWRMRAVAD